MSPGPRRELTRELLVDILREKLHAVVVCLSHSWGGLEQVAANDAVDAGALGLKVRVLCLEGTPIHQYLSSKKEVALLPLAFRPRNYFDFKLKGELERLIGQGTNLIHTHQTTLLGSIVPWLWKSPAVSLFATRHMMSAHDKRDLFHRMIYSRLDGLIVMSQTLRQNVLATHPIKDRRVKVVNLGLDFERFNPAQLNAAEQREKWGADPDTVVVGLVGRIDPAKGQATFIKAAAGLLKNATPRANLKFVIVGEETLGSDNRHLDELREMVRQFRLEDSVVFAGYQENIPEVMRAFDIFVMPSRQETFGLVAIEAMAMECPIVISSGGSAREIAGPTEDGEVLGLIMRPDDAFDLQRQLRWLLDNPAERVKMGQKARQHVVRHYDRQTRLRKTLEVYEQAIRRRSAL